METGNCGDYKIAIGGLCAAIGGLFIWIKALHKECGDAKDGRLADLKELYLRVKDKDQKGGA